MVFIVRIVFINTHYLNESVDDFIKAVDGLWFETLKEGQTYPEFLISAVELIVENLRNTD